MKLDFICMKVKLMKNKTIFAVKLFMKGTCTPNFSQFNVESQQELCPFDM